MDWFNNTNVRVVEYEKNINEVREISINCILRGWYISASCISYDLLPRQKDAEI